MRSVLLPFNRKSTIASIRQAAQNNDKIAHMFALLDLEAPVRAQRVVKPADYTGRSDVRQPLPTTSWLCFDFVANSKEE